MEYSNESLSGRKRPRDEEGDLRSAEGPRQRGAAQHVRSVATGAGVGVGGLNNNIQDSSRNQAQMPAAQNSFLQSTRRAQFMPGSQQAPLGYSLPGLQSSQMIQQTLGGGTNALGINEFLLQTQLQQQPSLFSGNPNASLFLARSMAPGGSRFIPSFNSLLSPSSPSAPGGAYAASDPYAASLLARARQSYAPADQQNLYSGLLSQQAAVHQHGSPDTSVFMTQQRIQQQQQQPAAAPIWSRPQAASRASNPSLQGVRSNTFPPPPTNMSNKNILYLPSDDDSVNTFQRFARQQIEFFEAGEAEAQSSAQGRNKPIVLGQVGIRCIHCADLPPKVRSRAAVYFPSKLAVLYQAAQNIVNVHLPELCESIPKDVRKTLRSLDNKRSRVGGGKTYWADAARVKGVIDSENGLRFEKKGASKS